MGRDPEKVSEVPACCEAPIVLPNKVSDVEIELSVERKKPILNPTSVVPKFSWVHSIVINWPGWIGAVGDKTGVAAVALLPSVFLQREGPMSVSLPPAG